MEEYSKQCQSCSMPLEDGKMSGTEADGSKAYKYCKYCYKNGAFTDPETTLDDMKKILDDTVGKEGLKGKVLAWMGKMQLSSLERWKSPQD